MINNDRLSGGICIELESSHFSYIFLGKFTHNFSISLNMNNFDMFNIPK